MRLPNALHPRELFGALDAIDREPTSWTLDRRTAQRRVFATLALVSVSLLLLHYAKFSSSFLWALGGVESWLGLPPQHWARALRAAGWLDLASLAWWSGWHLVAFVLLPWLLVRFVFGERLVDFGWRWGETHRHWRGYVLLASPILVLIVLVTLLREDFVAHYPFYRHAGRSWLDLAAWQALYIGQFVVLEFFFRGFMLRALRPALGASAVWIMCVPYMMIHLPKPWLEATGAILFGLFLGILALRSRSIWGGVAVHVTIALSMDLAALLYTGRVPVEWVP